MKKQFKWKLPVLLVFLFSMTSCFGGISCISIHLGGGGCLGDGVLDRDLDRPTTFEIQTAVGDVVRALR